MPSVPWGFWGWRPVRAAWKQLDGSRRRTFTDFWEFTVSDFRSEQQHCGFRWSEVAVTLDKQKWSSSEEKLKFRGGGDFWSVQFKRGLTQVKFASMVVLFRGESLIWFWGRHFFVQGIGGGCCCSLSEWNSCCYAVQFPPPPLSGCSILHNCAESVRWFILGTGCAVLWQGNFMKTKACRMAVLHQEEHQRVSRKWWCSYSDHWLVGSLVVTSQTGAFEYVTSGYGKLNCGTVVLLAEWLKNVLGSSVELKEQVQTFSTQLTPFFTANK